LALQDGNFLIGQSKEVVAGKPSADSASRAKEVPVVEFVELGKIFIKHHRHFAIYEFPG
jgi:hypothetical protein